MSRFANRSVLVTGAGSGAGAAMARRFAAEGADVVIADIDAAAGDAVAKEIDAPGRVLAVRTDVTDEDSVRALASEIGSELGRLDVLVNNAAATHLLPRDRELDELDVEVWDETMAVNLRGTMLCTKHSLPFMLAQGSGAIVTIASTGGLQGGSVLSAYGTSKAGLIGFTMFVATMYGRRNIRANTVSPGFIYNPQTADRMVPQQLETSDYERVLPDPASGDDIAAVVAFLASDDARAVTGANYVVDCGKMAHKPSYSVTRALGDGEFRR
jgi:NAD(P)-dependent dehydrogenase (short-subunit alcohol dehydrogenase family)